MFELQPGMVSKICESFKGLYLMVAEPSHDARPKDESLMPMAESGTRPKKSVSAHRWYFIQDPTAIPAEPIYDTSPHDRQRAPIA